MKTRRAFLTTAVGASVAVTAVAAPKVTEQTPALMSCSPASGGKNAKLFPHVIVQDQHRRKAWFYEELIKDKLVLVNFTSSRGENYYPIIENMVKVQEMLQDRLDKDVFMYIHYHHRSLS
jgi:protein SCO1